MWWISVPIIRYFKNHGIPFVFMLGLEPGSCASLVEMMFRILGLKNASRVVAAACIPYVSEKISIVSPAKKPIINNAVLFKSNGNIRMNSMYIKGFI